MFPQQNTTTQSSFSIPKTIIYSPTKFESMTESDKNIIGESSIGLSEFTNNNISTLSEFIGGHMLKSSDFSNNSNISTLSEFIDSNNENSNNEDNTQSQSIDFSSLFRTTTNNNSQFM
jgi:hypothetical protein